VSRSSTRCCARRVKALCHVTGGGLPGNLPRVLPDGIDAVVDERTWKRAPIFSLIEELGHVSADEMRSTFNCGIGLVAVVEQERAQAILEVFLHAGERATIIGSLAEKPANEPAEVRYL